MSALNQRDGTYTHLYLNEMVHCTHWEHSRSAKRTDSSDQGGLLGAVLGLSQETHISSTNEFVSECGDGEMEAEVCFGDWWEMSGGSQGDK